MSLTPNFSRRRRIATIAGVVVLALAAMVIGSAAARESTPPLAVQMQTTRQDAAPDGGGATKGVVPPEAFDPDGINVAITPDFIEALGQDGAVVGYIPKQYFDKGFQSGSQALPVYAADLQTLVGYHVPGKGFVPLGTNPDQVQDRDVQVAPSP